MDLPKSVSLYGLIIRSLHFSNNFFHWVWSFRFHSIYFSTLKSWQEIS